MTHNDSNPEVTNVMDLAPAGAARRHGLVSLAVVVAALMAGTSCVQASNPGTTLPSPGDSGPESEKGPSQVKENQEELAGDRPAAERERHKKEGRRADARARRLVPNRRDTNDVRDLLGRDDDDSESEADPYEGSDPREPPPAASPPDGETGTYDPYANPGDVDSADVNSHGGYAAASAQAWARVVRRVLRHHSKHARATHHRDARADQAPLPSVRRQGEGRSPAARLAPSLAAGEDGSRGRGEEPAARGPHGGMGSPSAGGHRIHSGPTHTPMPRPRAPSRGRRR